MLSKHIDFIKTNHLVTISEMDFIYWFILMHHPRIVSACPHVINNMHFVWEDQRQKKCALFSMKLQGCYINTWLPWKIDFTPE